MPEIEPNPRAKIVALEDRVKELEKFCLDLIKSLGAAETRNLFLLPEGKYFGITIE